ncbi:hypothetical protein P691DRAFT_786038 [Macrolepiota fuliginosa MF-IS2]|uniref:F-box domain-containing protein n=1 Tax=Macrolepiota fuliginosa MF-IS2 TaxID=1400762 RepID=A0A9P6C0N9_9AGAR|nr:hypothetical protein P691DRAFT_786038 [Macrolepiota fuliginosa MF-IS2]
MDEIQFLTATVSRLDREIEQLNGHRATLLRRLNQIRPITRILPPETLAAIFHHAALHTPSSTTDFFPSKKPARTSPLLLGSVCSHWRSVAWTTPALWTLIDPVPVRRNAQLSDAHLLRLYFTNARALPVSLHIKLDRLSSSPSAASEEILRAVFLDNSHNIGVLTCTSKSSLRQRWAMLAPKLAHAQFPNLERLEVNLRGAPLWRYDAPMLANAPRLTRATFAGYLLPNENEVFWEQITVLDLTALPVCRCLETLVQCPNLVDYRCTSPRPPTRSMDVALHLWKSQSAVTLEHLEKFEWVGALAEWDVLLYTYVRMPNLRHLVLGNSHPLSRPLDPTIIAPIPVPPTAPATGPNNLNNSDTNGASAPRTTDPELWKSFLRHIKNLTTLECTVFHSAQEWLDVFDIFSASLQTLKFTAFRDAEETLRLLRALQLTRVTDTDSIDSGADADTSSNPETKNYLPNLKALHATLDLHPDRSRHVLDILCSRRVRPMVLIPPEPTPTLSSGITSDPNALDNTDAQSMTSIASSTSESSFLTNQPSSSSTPDINVNDFIINPYPDTVYWVTHSRLEEASIKCWPFGFDFGDRERAVAKVLKRDGLKLDVFGPSGRVDWL